jgi:hypothetical protein
MKPTTKRPPTIVEDVESLFSEPQITTDLVAQYTNSLLENLITTEKAIHKDFYRIVLLFLVFLLLDSGLVENVSVGGTQIKNSGYILIMFPFAISFLYYQLNGRVGFAHEMRTCLALIFRKLNPNLYVGGFDLLLHYPSIRNIETHQGKLAEGKTARAVLELSTTVVVFVFILGPVAALAYTLYRTRKHSDLPIVLWIVITVISAIFVIRALTLGGPPRAEDLFSERKRSDAVASNPTHT